MAASESEGVLELLQFTGLRNTASPDRFNPGELTDAENVDIDDTLQIRRRKGYTQVLAGNYTSIWSSGPICLAVQSNTTLVQVLPNWTAVTLRTGMPSGFMEYVNLGVGKVGYSNGYVNGIVEKGANRTWGIEPPTYQPAATAVSGELTAGRYQYAVTFIRGDGQESGTPTAGVLDVPASGGISLTGIPQSTDSGVEQIRVYVSRPDGETLFHFGNYSVGTTTALIKSNAPDLAWPLENQFLSPPPVGNFLAVVDGHALVADGNTLYYSEPWAYELFDLRKNFRFLSLITLVKPVGNGVYLGTEDEIFWLEGTDPSQWKLVNKFEYGAVRGTAVLTTADLLFEGKGSGEAMLFHSTEGICAALSDGQIQNLTQDKFDFGSYDRGSAVIRRHDGMIQYVSTLRGQGEVTDNTLDAVLTLPPKSAVGALLADEFNLEFGAAFG